MRIANEVSEADEKASGEQSIVARRSLDITGRLAYSHRQLIREVVERNGFLCIF